MVSRRQQATAQPVLRQTGCAHPGSVFVVEARHSQRIKQYAHGVHEIYAVLGQIALGLGIVPLELVTCTFAHPQITKTPNGSARESGRLISPISIARDFFAKRLYIHDDNTLKESERLGQTPTKSDTCLVIRFTSVQNQPCEGVRLRL